MERQAEAKEPEPAFFLLRALGLIGQELKLQRPSANPQLSLGRVYNTGLPLSAPPTMSGSVPADPVMENFTAERVLGNNSYLFESDSAADFERLLREREYDFVSVGYRIHGCLDAFFEMQEWFQTRNGFPATITVSDEKFFSHPFAFRFHAVTKALEGYPLQSSLSRRVPKRLDILGNATKWQTYVRDLKRKFEVGTFPTEDEFWDDYWRETGGAGESPFKPSRMIPRVKALLLNKDFLNSRSFQDFVHRMNEKYLAR